MSPASYFSITSCCTSHSSEVYIALQVFTSWTVKLPGFTFHCSITSSTIELGVLLGFYFTIRGGLRAPN